MQRKFGILSVVAIVVAALLGHLAASYKNRPPDYVVQGAAEASIQMGEQHPSAAVWVYDSAQKMYIVVLHGHFGGYPHMPKGAVFKGTVAEVFVDTEHHFGGEDISNKEVDLSKFGTSHPFLGEIQQAINHRVALIQQSEGLLR